MKFPLAFTRLAWLTLATAFTSSALGASFQPQINVPALLTWDTASSGGNGQIFLRADGYPTPAWYRWTKDGRNLPNGDRDVYETSQVNFSSAGYYRLTVEAEKEVATSKAVPVGVVKTGTTLLPPLPEGRSVTLTQVASGPELSFQWYFEGNPLSDLPGKISGSQSSRIRLSNVSLQDEGTYRCIVSQRGLSITGQDFVLNVVLKPVITDAKGFDDWAVGRPVSASFDSDNEPTRYEIRGLPPGLKFNPKTGQITGKPTTAGRYTISVRAINAAGASEWFKLKVQVAPFPREATGTFHGLVGRTGGGDPGYGGSFRFVVSGNGAFTGSVDVGRVRYPISGRFENPLNGQPEIWIQAAHGWLVLNIKIDPTAGRADGLVALNDWSFQLPLEAKKVLPQVPNSAPANWLGLHYVKVSPSASVIGNSTYPQEESIGRITVRNNATYNWTGRLSDGSAYTMSGRITPQGAFASHTWLYGRRGSLQGWQELLEPEGWVSGFLEWIKYPSAGGSTFPGGFPLHSLDVREPGVAP